MPSRFLSDPSPVEVSFPAASHRRNLHHRIGYIASIAATAAVILLLLLLVALLIYRTRRRRSASRSRTAPSSPPSVELPDRTKPTRFTYEQLRKATGMFGSKIGQGGFGSVFRGVLPSGREIAVKLMDVESVQGEIEFQNELSLASSMLKFEEAEKGAGKYAVFPLGFCSEEEEAEDERRRKRRRRKKRKVRKKKRSWFDNIEDEDDLDADRDGDLDGDEGMRRRFLLLVYDLMHNGSLQDALLVRRCPEMMQWERRFAVVLDVARGLEFLHTVCDPPILHGDIKPSNILLDSCFAARIGDFGLARVLMPDLLSTSSPLLPFYPSVKPEEVGSDGDHNKSPEQLDLGVDPVSGGTLEINVDAAAGTENGLDHVSLEDESFPVGESKGEGLVSPVASHVVSLEMASTSEAGGLDMVSVGSGTEFSGTRTTQAFRSGNGGKSSGKDWWWQQEGEGRHETRIGIKDYVMEWIGSEIGKERPKENCLVSEAPSSSSKLVPLEVKNRKRRHIDWWTSLDRERSRGKKKTKEKSRPAREWWREEYCDELVKKKMKNQQMIMPHSVEDGGDVQDCKDSGLAFGKRSRKKSSRSRCSTDWSRDDLGWDSRLPGHRNSHDWGTGDVPKSGGVSSTPSMRGTMCYAAPECCGEVLSEKCDIYSFGVLLLVIISGRRPLQVTASPMSEFERANLISWARHLARRGKLLDLVDSSLLSVNQEQVLLCITLALLCLQRSPACRPSIEEIVEMLSGNLEPPHLPSDLSPSPAYALKSRRKVR